MRPILSKDFPLRLFEEPCASQIVLDQENLDDGLINPDSLRYWQLRNRSFYAPRVGNSDVFLGLENLAHDLVNKIRGLYNSLQQFQPIRILL